jgi:uncharacterized protein YceH (UPF0502 family)
MSKNNSFIKKIVPLCVALLAVIIAWGGLVPTIASSQEQSRINALEVDINGIESRLNRIESQLNQFRRFESPGVPSPPSSPINPGRNRSQLNRDQMFDRLATLVVELKQQVNKLEVRVSKLESRGAPRNTR